MADPAAYDTRTPPVSAAGSANWPFPARVRRCTIRTMNRLLVVFLLASIPIAAGDKPAKTYPEHGRVVAIRTGENSKTLPVYTDPYGKTRGGFSVSSKTHTYRIETETRFYELTEERRGAIASLGDIVDFRIEKKDKAFVRNGEKEWKCMVTGVEQKSLHSKPKL